MGYMCGIFAYAGTRTATPILIDGLRTLEYRGYDSAGVFIPKQGSVKAVGPIDNLAAAMPSPFVGTTGIAHTRWATHGAPTEGNAHPHLDASGSIALVHNGIIENYRELREGLSARGIAFDSETDSEVLAKLIGSFYEGGDILPAVQAALRDVRGTFGVVVASDHQPERLIAARRGSPIVLGLGKDGNLIASDPAALLAHTKDVVYLDDDELAIITPKHHEVQTLGGKKQARTAEKVEWSVEAVKKQGFDHFMAKEIFEGPEAVANTIRGRLIAESGHAKLGGLEMVASRLADISRLTIVACGSAAYAGMVGRYMLEEYAGFPVEVELGSEYRYKRSYPEKQGAVLAVTQSGETADTLASVRAAKEHGLMTLGMVNVVGSTIARETEAGVYNHVGPEVAVASTKAFISQLTVFALLTLFIGRERGLAREEGIEITESLAALPATIESVLTQSDRIADIASRYAAAENAMFIGRKFHAPIAFEGALKLKEVTYTHAEAYPAGELKHGSIALLDEQFPVVALAPQDDVYEKMVSNIEEVRARKAPVIAVGTEGDTYLPEITNDTILVPKVHPILQPIVSTVPLQLLAYHVGVARGLNVDRPRNLAKSVTVE